MKILVTGKQGSGSWMIRGEQLGSAANATVRPHAPEQLMREHDVVVLVKRPPAGFADAARHAGTPVVWDVVDAWPQPDANAWEEGLCVHWLLSEVQRVGAVAVLCPNDSMVEALTRKGVPALSLPHHYMPDRAINPIRPKVRKVGYQGRDVYLSGDWRKAIEAACAKRGWEFVSEPMLDLASVDIAVAFRDGHWNGWIASAWKSNVKLANAMGTGTPIVLAREDSYCQWGAGVEPMPATPAQLDAAFEHLTSHESRAAVSRVMLSRSSTFQLANVAAALRSALRTIRGR